jgi:sulfate adenylyltransferase
MSKAVVQSGNILNPPVYGGGESLVNQEAKWADYQDKAQQWPKLTMATLEVFDLYLIAIGAYSPLQGFMGKADYQSVVDNMTLQNGLPWSIPITLTTTEAKAEALNIGDTLLLENEQGLPMGVLELQEVYRPDKTREAEKVYRTTEDAHPGVKVLLNRGTVYLAGPVKVFTDHISYEAKEKHLPPVETRRIFKERGWRSVVAFQTRNPIHRAHEYLQKCALEMVDGLFVHPLMGETKSDDIPAATRMKCYEALLNNYYNMDRVLLGVYPAAMRYAGPREAILHAIVRQNYGCTHFIVGRDHAGVGNYYGTYDAQTIFQEIDRSRMAITPICFEHSFFCKTCQQLVTMKTCPHDSSHHVMLSGTKVREKLVAGEDLPLEFTRKEISDILQEDYRQQNPSS